MLGFACARFRRLRLVLWLFASCFWDVLRYRIFMKAAFDFLDTWSSSFCNVWKWFNDFRKNHPKKIGLIHQKENTSFPKRRWVRFKIVCFSSALLFSVVVTKKYMFWELPEVSLFWTIRNFCSNAESRFGCVSYWRLCLVLWLFTSCVWDVLWYRILIKTAFVSWAKQKLSKTTLGVFQKCPFELRLAFFFGCK